MANKHQRMMRYEERQEQIRAAGVQAYHAGAQAQDNPFKIGSEDYLCWEQGWDTAASSGQLSEMPAGEILPMEGA